MSHRVTTQTSMKNAANVKEACKQQDVSFQEHGTTIRFTSGPLNTASLDLTTGTITGDTDRHSASTLGALKQAYGEVSYRFECMKQGITVESRTVEKNGDITLMCASA